VLKKYYPRDSGTGPVGRLNHSKGAAFQKKKESRMSSKVSSFRIRAALAVGLTAAALSISLGPTVATAANGDKYATSHRVHHERAVYAAHRSPGRQAEVLPYGPEYGFLSHVPANAIRMPGYTFVPGVGILGASCDLPTSACSNQYRDIQ
jgi:hypothetical protein